MQQESIRICILFIINGAELRRRVGRFIGNELFDWFGYAQGFQIISDGIAQSDAV
jgi:hypothetical protein